MLKNKGKMKGPKTYVLKAESAFTMNGNIVRRGELVEVSEKEATNLLHRGKAILEGADEKPEGAESGSLEDMKKADLLELAEAGGIDVPESATKAEIIALIQDEEKSG